LLNAVLSGAAIAAMRPSCVCVQDEVPSNEAYEHSELLMYKAQVLAEGGQQAAALALLDAEQVRHRAAANRAFRGASRLQTAAGTVVPLKQSNWAAVLP
jgi:hypothetical protein